MTSACAGWEQKQPLLPHPNPATISWAHLHKGCTGRAWTWRRQGLSPPTQWLLTVQRDLPGPLQLKALLILIQGHWWLFPCLRMTGVGREV